MNYFAHGRHFIDRPYFLAGTAVPDWLNVVDRRIRVRERLARPFASDKNRKVAELAAGVVQHHRDDAWFHQTRVFTELSWQFTVQIRDLLPRDDGLRPSFLGHILVEIMLDAVLIETDYDLLAEYYSALSKVEGDTVASAVARMTGSEPERMAEFIQVFLDARFLYDYVEDAKLLFRLNQVMSRVKLASLPEQPMLDFLPGARERIRRHTVELLTAPADQNDL